MTRLEPVHPGEVLKHDFMDPFGLSATALAKALGVMPARINEIVRRRRGITVETALRLARYFNTDARSWMNLQNRYELEIAARDKGEALGYEWVRKLCQRFAAGGTGGSIQAGGLGFIVLLFFMLNTSLILRKRETPKRHERLYRAGWRVAERANRSADRWCLLQ